MENVNSVFRSSILGYFGLFFFTICLLFGCAPNPATPDKIATSPVIAEPVPLEIPVDTGLKNAPKMKESNAGASKNNAPTLTAQKSLPTTKSPEKPADFTVVTALDRTIRLDIRYATKNNFTQSSIYDCPACLLRPAAAAALVKAHQALKSKGYGGLKMFDCYRPRPFQQRLWDKVPNPNYVTPPAKGSMHSRGAAVDLTVVDKNGNELDMGTPYDFFGEQAHTDYTKLPEKVMSNRRLLKEAMEAAGFKGIRTEWWHFSFRNGQYPLSDYIWPCE